MTSVTNTNSTFSSLNILFHKIRIVNPVFGVLPFLLCDRQVKPFSIPQFPVFLMTCPRVNRPEVIGVSITRNVLFVWIVDIIYD